MIIIIASFMTRCATSARKYTMDILYHICEYINRFLQENKLRRNCALSLTNWIQLRQQFLSAIKKWTLRKLKQYEEQMILFAKSCSICHRHCRTCYSDYYCSDHISRFTLVKMPTTEHTNDMNIFITTYLCSARNTIIEAMNSKYFYCDYVSGHSAME
ncbi:uncharacterized protein LOC116849617 isoform X2 [Odontomachus brunneus]|uniref:uncharacterized protein LOC116849617 isoform X2 n=1 Tax=Odontomachus brunneus TaxID=486640 RepID=UPI0013F1EA05|nr:uncharacterized protein LOC116849617 isoform X2 [Odontomachus brunneus]